jgi:hypothetical protein
LAGACDAVWILMLVMMMIHITIRGMQQNKGSVHGKDRAGRWLCRLCAMCTREPSRQLVYIESAMAVSVWDCCLSRVEVGWGMA